MAARISNALTRVLPTLLLCGAFFLRGVGQTDGPAPGSDLFNTARTFIKTGDYSNAVLVLNQAVQADPNNLEYLQELAYAEYLRQDYDHAFSLIHQLLERDDADELTYQIAGDIYQARNDYNGANRVYEKGLKKFPESGELNNDLGSLLYKEKKYQDALRTWVNGIMVDPSFAGNYYNAARMYYYSKDNTWSIIYGEIFINLESFSQRTAEMRGILLASYKKLFDNPQLLTSGLDGPAPKTREESASEMDFRTAFLQILTRQAGVIATGITTENLIMLRTRFLLDWESRYIDQFPFALFSYQQQLARQGLFEAYNQWIFGPAANAAQFRNWMNLHKDRYEELSQYMGDHPLKPVLDQAYNAGKIEFEENGTLRTGDPENN